MEKIVLNGVELKLPSGQLKPEFANSIDECTDTSKVYVLPDGYIYAYMIKTTSSETKEVVEDITEGFVDDRRLSVSAGTLSDITGYVTTPFIDFSQYPIDAEIRLSGIDWASTAVTNGYAMCLYNEDQILLDGGASYAYLGERGIAIYNAKYVASDVSNLVFKAFDITKALDYKYVRFCGKGTSTNAIVQIVYTTETSGEVVTEWTNTGHAFVPADYEDRIVGLEEQTSDHEKRIKILEANDDGSGVSEYWLEELETKADTIQQTIEAAGRNKSAFLWYTDSHWQYTNAKVAPLLLKYLIKNTPINKVNFGGDVVSDPSEFVHKNIAYVYEWRKTIADLPNHHSVYGNHDVSHRTTDVGNMAYALLLADEETSDMVVGGDSYYCIDYPSEKTRYLYLSYLTNDHTEMMEQGKFIVDAISNVADGWHIVVIAHRWFQYTSSSAPTVGSVPAYETEILSIFDAYNARTTRASSNYFYEQDFSGGKGKVEFCIGGHIHVDYDFASDGGIPIIITASDTNQTRGDNETASGTIGTITESAVFGIIADYDNNKITVVGVGRGTSREILLNTT